MFFSIFVSVQIVFSQRTEAGIVKEEVDEQEEANINDANVNEVCILVFFK